MHFEVALRRNIASDGVFSLNVAGIDQQGCKAPGWATCTFLGRFNHRDQGEWIIDN
jgi:hypothetical protein